MPPGSGPNDTTITSSAPSLPERIGRYSITRLIGAGGMGAVYEAEQDQPKRTVALKVMRAAVASPAALRRFEYESQLLAKLRHPCIAQVYDAGTHLDRMTGQSVPFFAMEYIPDAKPLTSYAEGANLPLRARVELFIKVCDAVQHGHQRGVIHRDLKPANILVDQHGSPKIIDFGVARSADAEAAQVMQHTTAGQLVGTLQYMSPEQCAGDVTDIDVRADVYALGVTLFELLTGHLPHELNGRSLSEAIRLVREAPPAKPSTWKREVRGDLETIILKTLEKAPAQRYDSASALAADLSRFLNHETILARPIGPVGRFARWVRRNRAVATVVSISLAILVTTSVVLVSRILQESHRANSNLEVAERNLRASKESFSLVKGLFGSMKPDNTMKGFVDVPKILDAAAGQLASKAPEMPATEADYREVLAVGYFGMGMYGKAIDHQRKVVEIRERILPDPDPLLADSLHKLGASLWWHGDYEDADRAYTRSLAMRRKLYGAEHAEIATSLTHLAACYLREGRLSDAEEYYTQALNMRRKLLGEKGPEIAASINNLAKCLSMQGDPVRALPRFRQAYEMISSIKGDADLETASAAHNLAQCLIDAGQADEAKDLFQKALAIRTAKLPAQNNLIASSTLGLAQATFASAPGADPIAMAKRALGVLESVLPSDHPDIADASGAVGRMYVKLGKMSSNQNDLENAETYFRRALSIYKDPKRATAWDLPAAQLRLGDCLAALKRYEEAEKLLTDCVATLNSDRAPDRLRTDARETLAHLYEAQGKTDEANRVRSTNVKSPKK